MRSGYYAYVPREDGTEPLGTFGRIIRYDLKTDRGAIRAAVKAIGAGARVYRFTSLYNESTFRRIR